MTALLEVFTTPIFATLSYICLWYSFSLGMTFYNKWLFDTSVRFNYWGLECPVLSWTDTFKKIFPTGIVAALDISLSNFSLMLIDITLYTMCKSTVLAFTLVFACIFRLERLSLNLVLVIFMISGGVVLFRAKEGIYFESIGFFLVLTASAMGGLRWVLTQTIMHRYCTELKHPIDTLYHIAPCMGVTLLPFALAIEGPRLMKSNLMFSDSIDAGMVSLTLVVMGSCIAFGLVLSEFMLVRCTSSVTLSVAGIFKELCTVSLAVLLSGETLTGLNVGGLLLSIAGIAYYNVLKYYGLTSVGGHGHARINDSAPSSRPPSPPKTAV